MNSSHRFPSSYSSQPRLLISTPQQERRAGNDCLNEMVKAEAEVLMLRWLRNRARRCAVAVRCRRSRFSFCKKTPNFFLSRSPLVRTLRSFLCSGFVMSARGPRQYRVQCRAVGPFARQITSCVGVAVASRSSATLSYPSLDFALVLLILLWVSWS